MTNDDDTFLGAEAVIRTELFLDSLEWDDEELDTVVEPFTIEERAWFANG